MSATVSPRRLEGRPTCGADKTSKDGQASVRSGWSPYALACYTVAGNDDVVLRSETVTSDW